MFVIRSAMLFCQLIEAEWRKYASVNLSSLVQILACLQVGAKLLSKQMLNMVNANPRNKQWNLKRNLSILFAKMHLKMSSAILRHISLGPNVLQTHGASQGHTILSHRIKPSNENVRYIGFYDAVEDSVIWNFPLSFRIHVRFNEIL